MVRVISNQRGARKAAMDPRLGTVFTGRVIDLGSDGRAVVQHPSGLRLFIVGAWPGEEVVARIKEIKQSVGSAELLELRQASTARVQPSCRHHGTGPGHCGGCPWMFVDYDAQLAAKQQRVLQVLAGLVPADRVRPVWPSQQQLGYRSRAQLKTDGQVVGFVQSGSRALAPVEDCQVLSEPNRQTLQNLRKRLPEPQWRPQSGHSWTTLDIDEQVDASTVSINQRLPFHQANAGQNSRMRAWLRENIAAIDRSCPVLELFAGAGNFTAVLAELGFEQVTAVEVVDAALDALRALNLPNVRLAACDLFDAAAVERLLAGQADTQVLVLDPPRDGLKVRQPFMDRLPHLRQIFYISCDLATFRRDAEDCLKSGFRLSQVQPLDLFPQTPHVELLALFERT